MSRFERWSRLKRGEMPPSSEATAAPHEGDGPDPQAALCDEPARESVPSGSQEPGSLDHTLPDPDTLPAGSDIKAYLASGVSRGLRKRALRRLFAGDHYGLRDGLDDYDDDYRQTLQPLAGEVAGRLRHWTRRQPDPDEAPVEAGEATGADVAPVDTDHSPLDDATTRLSRERDEKAPPEDEAGRSRDVS
ncbi:MAG: DUF3306 domain-containing protein [Pseudomonadota bacterium]